MVARCINLHSTMYLLKHNRDKEILKRDTLFTFHYVSIKTIQQREVNSVFSHLHSTMYLLKLCK